MIDTWQIYKLTSPSGKAYVGQTVRRNNLEHYRAHEREWRHDHPEYKDVGVAKRRLRRQDPEFRAKENARQQERRQLKKLGLWCRALDQRNLIDAQAA